MEKVNYAVVSKLKTFYSLMELAEITKHESQNNMTYVHRKQNETKP